jgi:hypothetical protein
LGLRLRRPRRADISGVQVSRARIPDAAATRAWIGDAGLVIASEETIPEGDSAHTLFWAQRPAPAGPAEPGSQ